MQNHFFSYYSGWSMHGINLMIQRFTTKFATGGGGGGGGGGGFIIDSN